MIRIEDIIEKVGKQFPNADVDLLRRAYFLAALHLKPLQLPSGEPYLVRCLKTANILADLGQDEVCVSAGLIYYVIAETAIGLEVIRQSLGDELVNILDRSIQSGDLLEIPSDPRATTVKLAVHLTTLRSLMSLPANERDQIVDETVRTYIPLAHRLRFDNLRREYEILVYPYT